MTYLQHWIAHPDIIAPCWQLLIGEATDYFEVFFFLTLGCLNQSYQQLLSFFVQTSSVTFDELWRAYDLLDNLISFTIDTA